MENILGALGPKGTYTHEAAKSYSDSQIRFFATIHDVIDAVANGTVKEAIVPFENSIHGVVIQTLEGIYRQNLFVKKQLVLDIHHCLAGVNNKLECVTTIYSHPQALGQCAQYLREHFPNATQIEVSSTSYAMELVKKENNPALVAIGPALAAKINKLEVIDTDIQDENENQTAFYVISKELELNKDASKSLIVCKPQKDFPGLLHFILSEFVKYEINLAMIESRPSRNQLGTYIFYMIIQTADEKVKKNISQALSEKEITFYDLGTY